MFILKTDLPSTMYGYQLEQITEGNDDIIDIAMAAAEQEIRSYLTGNNRIEYHDGRLKYDVEAIMTATGAERNPLILKHAITITKWWIVDLCNADIIYEQTKERYDRARNWLKDLANGEINLNTLPQLDPEQTDVNTKPFSFGSRKKFNHE